MGLEAALSDEHRLLSDDVVPLLTEVLRSGMMLLSLRETREVRSARHIGRIIRFVDDLGTAGGIALGRHVLEGKRAVSPLVLNAGQVCSVLARRLPLNESATWSSSLLAQIFAVFLGEACGGVLLLKAARGTSFLAEATLLTHS